MGNNSFAAEQRRVPRTVTFLPNSISEDHKYQAIDCKSIRYCELTAYKSQRNTYLFSMKMRNQIDIRECIPVLNELVHCISYDNYQVKLQPRMIIDIFDRKLTSTLINVKNQKSMSQFTMKIIPFSTYNSIQFKKAFYQLYLNKQPGLKSVKLLDYYIYGLNPDQQAFVFLFQKCITSLANVAEYRKQANMPWTLKEKIKIIYQILQSYESLYNRNIIHRDLRPSNIFMTASTGKFAIGNLSRARLLRRNYESDLMSVCGVPDFSCPQMQVLMQQGQQIGYYDGMRQDYCGMKSILNIIQTCEIYDNNPAFKQAQLAGIANMFNSFAQPRAIMLEMQKLVAGLKVDLYTEIGDRNIAESCSTLLVQTHKSTIEKYMFQVYGYLGFHKDYSDKAHKMLDKNNESNKQYENAPILRNLGDYYQGKGLKGTQYYYNSFILYILRADNQIRFGFPGRAQKQLDGAKQVYFKFNKTIQSQLPRIQINRISSLIQLQNQNDIKNSVSIINDTFIKAAQNNIPVDKQCKILLAYGKIYRKLPQTRPEALKKLNVGLTICENSGVFQSPAVCRIYKSKFLKEIGKLYIGNLQSKMDPRRKQTTEEQVQLKTKAQIHLRSALQIQERQTVDDLQVADTLQNLGKLYYLQQNFYDAKRYYDNAKIRYAHMKQLINPMKQVNVLYMRGSCCYYLKQYNQAKIDYETCLFTLQALPKTPQNQILFCNIQGNLGITLLKQGKPNGKEVIQAALNEMKELKGQKSYDYAALYHHYINATEPMR